MDTDKLLSNGIDSDFAALQTLQALCIYGDFSVFCNEEIANMTFEKIYPVI